MSKRPVIRMPLVAVLALMVGVAWGAEGNGLQEEEEEEGAESMNVGRRYSCRCSDHVGEWTGTYSSREQLEEAVRRSCRDENRDGIYGYCKPLD